MRQERDELVLLFAENTKPARGPQRDQPEQSGMPDLMQAGTVLVLLRVQAEKTYGECPRGARGRATPRYPKDHEVAAPDKRAALPSWARGIGSPLSRLSKLDKRDHSELAFYMPVTTTNTDLVFQT